MELFAQPQKKEIEAKRINSSIHIDGFMNEEEWETAQKASDFTQVEPFNGKAANQKSEVSFLYDNTAIYIGAMLYDKKPDSILTFLSKRDDNGMADYFGVYIDPFNDALNAFGFFVTSMGVQMDYKSTVTGEDPSWDAVWESAVQLLDDGWSVELKIPYSALRFPKTPKEKWGLHIFRVIQRNREVTSWNFVDNSIDGFNQQAGILKGIKDIDPPIRLSFTPYTSVYLEKDSDLDEPGYSFKGGLDLKYGISESFTLDMMVIPDFGQVQSDDEVLNLTPFETYYDEKRAFFTEGTEMFSKADIFYSRRIGGKPARYDEVEDMLTVNEEISENPNETQLINATKVSGKTKKGLGIGFLNAVTEGSYAEIQDTLTGKTRSVRTQSLSNYNLIVLDQSLPNNSYVSVINTNVNRFDDKYKANVTGVDIKLSNKKNSYAVFGKGALSQIKDDTLNNEFGHYYELDFAKTSGQFKYSLSHKVESHTYEPNDFGYLQSNNEFNNGVYLQYNFYDPFWRILNWHNNLNIEHEMLYKPREYSSLKMNFHSVATFRNHLSAGVEINGSPVKMHDYYETRVEGRYYVLPEWYSIGAWISPDYSKRLAIDVQGGSMESEF